MKTPLLLLVLSVVWTTGCARKQPVVLGRPPSTQIISSIAGIKASPGPLTIRGAMIEKCPIAGCWFRVQDGTGAIKVDTKNAGFVVSDVPLNTQVTVSGRLKKSGEREIEASGVSYQ